MARFVPCVYCLDLPPLDKARTGKVGRCPLCKSENLTTRSAATYRLRTPEGEPIAFAPDRGAWLVGLLAVAAACCMALVLGLLRPAKVAVALSPSVAVTELATADATPLGNALDPELLP